uniref:Uncharacterized protein n=1 Tax=Ditylenchus dipsaci TaxID=166011 RepID=A0A915EC39_9BILA
MTDMKFNIRQQVSKADDDVKEVEYRDISKERIYVRESALQRYKDQISRTKTQLDVKLRELLGCAKNVDEMWPGPNTDAFTYRDMPMELPNGKQVIKDTWLAVDDDLQPYMCYKWPTDLQKCLKGLVDCGMSQDPIRATRTCSGHCVMGFLNFRAWKRRFVPARMVPSTDVAMSSSQMVRGSSVVSGNAAQLGSYCPRLSPTPLN